MSHALVSEHIRIYLKAGETRLSMLLGTHDKQDRPASRSALQNPELNRYELDRMLRRNERRPDRSVGGWQSLIASRNDGCANSNTVLT
jgi:hypothetical protein